MATSQPVSASSTLVITPPTPTASQPFTISGQFTGIGGGVLVDVWVSAGDGCFVGDIPVAQPYTSDSPPGSWTSTWTLAAGTYSAHATDFNDASGCVAFYVQPAPTITGTLSSSTITVGTSSITISGIDTYDGPNVQDAVWISVWDGDCPGSGIVAGIFTGSTDANSAYGPVAIDTSTLSLGPYCVLAQSSTQQGPTVNDPLTVTSARTTTTTTIEVPYSICVIQLGVQEQNGTIVWLPGYAYPGTPISQCQNKTEVLGQDVLDRTIVMHQFIMKGTSFKIVTILPLPP